MRPGPILWYYGYYFLVAALALEFHDAIGFCEQRIILSLTHIKSGDDFRAALANYNRAGVYTLAAVGLYAKTLSIGVASVFGGTKSLFVCQETPLSMVNPAI